MTQILRYIFLLVIISLTNPTSGFSKESLYYFKHLTIDNGLSQNSAICILQDRKGFMWFGTKDGLNRYDGNRLKIFSPDNTGNQLEDCCINTICEDKNGNIWIGTDKGISFYNPISEKIKKLNDYLPNGQKITNRIRSIIADKNNVLWIAVEFKGIYAYYPQTNKLQLIQTDDNQKIPTPTYIYEDKDGMIWIETVPNGLFYFDPTSHKLKLFRLKNNEIFSHRILNMLETGRELYLGTFDQGLFKLNKETREVKPVLEKDNNQKTLNIHSLLRVNKHEVWIGSETGLYIYNEESGTFKHLMQSYIDKFALSDKAIYSFCKDKDGGLWIGTYFGGINYLPSQYTPFNKYYPLNDGKSISGKAVREFCEDNQGFIWIGTEDAGLNRFNPSTGEFTQFKELYSKSQNNNIHALQLDEDRLWIGTFNDGLYLMDLKTKRIKHYGPDKVPRDVFALLKDRTGKIWLGTFQGAFMYNSTTDSFVKMNNIGNYFIYDIKEDQSGHIWFAALNLGVIQYNPVNKEKIYFRNNPNDINSISPKIIGIYIDRTNNVWLCSEGMGIYRLNRKTGKFRHYTTADGLPDNVVYYITEDQNGYLWFGTNKGLASFNPENEEIKTFSLENGLLSNQFNYKSAYTSKDGTIYMGTVNGFISFNPLLFKKNQTEFTPILTGFQIFNNEVPINENSPLKQSITNTTKITLSYNQNTLSFDFATLNYNSSQVHYYNYKLEGIDNKWITLKDNQKITYSNLAPGQYQLRIKSTGSAKECRLDIVINPPFWLSIYAYLFYFALIIMGIYTILSRINKKHNESLQMLDEKKEKETYDAKISFFTNVAHEIRTPLSLIKGPLEHILKADKVDNETKEDLLIMQSNSDRLLALINQLLDFRKTESGKFSTNFHKQNILFLLNGIYERFSPSFRQKGITFESKIQQDKFLADVDEEAFTKIISNLFTNALKHSEKFVSLELKTDMPDENHFSVILKNDGNIIAEELFEKIFEPFFQISTSNGEAVNTGTGIGLPLAKSLAELHNGRLYIRKESENYNTFILELPKHQVLSTDKQANEEEEINIAEISENSEMSDKCSILVIEDHEEMQAFIRKHLSLGYLVFTASNGLEALSVMEAEHLDLIISDISMPKMNGFEFLRNIKSDLRYSHIPVIFLTAQTNLQSKIESLELGADAYIEKPFSMDFLIVQIKNLLESRKKLRDSFVHSPYLHSNAITISKADEEFIEKINQLVEQNLENIDFKIDYLTDAMFISRSSLFRKIKGITGLTINEYIRIIRLKKAAQLLVDGKYRINEICFLTGFSNSSYFAKCFYKQFGVLPKEFANSARNEKKASQ